MLQYTKKFIHSTFIYQYTCLSQDTTGLNPLDQDYEHFNECGTRLQGKLDECNRCRYVWNHWYGTTVMFTSIDEGTRNKKQSS